ncbi:MAG: RsfA family transcriptional regulator [Vulcanibacillus sp.]
MVANRQDAWTEDDDLLLAEVTLRHVREGGTQLSAFEEVGRKLNRTAAACGFRWNSLVRKKYEAAIRIAKAQKQKRNYQKSYLDNVENINDSGNVNILRSDEDSLTYDNIINFLKRQKTYNSDIYKNSRKFEKVMDEKNKEIEQLKIENNVLKEKVNYIETDYKVVNEDYKALVQIIDRARKLAFLENDKEEPKAIFKMDYNGNLERINK